MSCEFGIESTVIKIEETNSSINGLSLFNLSILRFGSLSEETLAHVISNSEEFKNIITISKKQKETTISEHTNSDTPG